MIRYTSLRKYKSDLLKELGGADEDTRTSALMDTEEHLHLLVKDIIISDSRISKRKAFHQAVESFGYPSEIADAYRTLY